MEHPLLTVVACIHTARWNTPVMPPVCGLLYPSIVFTLVEAIFRCNRVGLEITRHSYTLAHQLPSWKSCGTATRSPSLRCSYTLAHRLHTGSYAVQSHTRSSTHKRRQQIHSYRPTLPSVKHVYHYKRAAYLLDRCLPHRTCEFSLSGTWLGSRTPSVWNTMEPADPVVNNQFCSCPY